MAKMVWIVFGIILTAIVILPTLFFGTKTTWIVLGIILAAVVVLPTLFFLVIWFFLAPTNRFFTFVQEGTAKIIVKADQFNKALIQWESNTFDREWNIIRGEEHHLLGGLRFYGFWPLYDVFVYRLRWNDLHKSAEKDGRIEEVKFHDEVLDFVLLRPDVYWTKIPKAETKPPERIPVDVEFVTTMRVINPYKALFVAPPNWIENVMTRLDAQFRGFVANRDLDTLLNLEGIGREIWDEIGRGELVQTVMKEEWGIEIEENGIQVKDINMTQEFQEAAAKQRTEEMKAAGEQRRIEAVYGKIQEYGDLGKLVRMLEAMEKSPEQGSKWVIPLPGAAEFLREVFGGRPPEAVTREEIHELREIIKELKRERETSTFRRIPRGE